MNLLGQTEGSSKVGNALVSSLIFFVVFYFILFFMTPKEDKQSNHTSKTGQEISSDNKNDSMILENQTKRFNKIPEKTVKIETDKFLMEFSSQEGTISKIQLKQLKNGHNDLFDLTPSLNSINQRPLSYIISGYDFNKGFELKQESSNHIIFSQTVNGLRLEKHFVVSPDNYSLNIHIMLINTTNKDIDANTYLGWGIGLGPFISKEDRVQYDTVINIGFYDNILSKEKNISKGSSSEVANVQWVGIDNRYFLAAIMPDQEGKSLVNMNFVDPEDPYSQFMQLGNHIIIPKQGSTQQAFTVFIGPKKKELLASYNKNLEVIAERGWFFFPLLGQLLISILGFLKGLVGSYAIAIILFAILLRLIFHPLNMQSMIATARQAELQVKIQAIKEKYPDKQVQNIKIMELYKSEQVNLFKGCLPLLIQIPFFITFYQQLPHLVDLAQVHFLWIKDLSSPDSLLTIQTFRDMSFLPYHINLLPIIITLVTIFQMKLTTKNQANNSQAKIMMYLMPIIFLFILWSAPAALNLYWLTQTIATIAVQMYFNKNKVKILKTEKLKRKMKRKGK